MYVRGAVTTLELVANVFVDVRGDFRACSRNGYIRGGIASTRESAAVERQLYSPRSVSRALRLITISAGLVCIQMKWGVLTLRSPFGWSSCT